MISIVDVPWLTNSQVEQGAIGWRFGSNEFNYVRFNDDAYNLPDNCHIDKINTQMVKISYINCTIVNGKIMAASDKYNAISVKSKIHNVDGKYF